MGGSGLVAEVHVLHVGQGDGRCPLVVGNSYGADYLVLGVTHASADSIKIPDYKTGGYINHPMNRGVADITARIIKLTTGDIVATFSVNGVGNDITADTASRTAIKVAAQKAAEELENRFKKISMTVRSNSKNVWQ